MLVKPGQLVAKEYNLVKKSSFVGAQIFGQALKLGAGNILSVFNSAEFANLAIVRLIANSFTSFVLSSMRLLNSKQFLKVAIESPVKSSV